MAGMEERTFSEAELELFAGKYETFLKAQKEVEEIVSFLKKQHGAEGEGWQIGQTGFFRTKEDPAAAIVDVVGNNGEETKGKK